MARIRNADRALIEAAKLRGYLLSPTHPVGRFKAIFFRSLGYSVSQWRRLEADLRAHLLENETESHEDTPYGRKFTVRGTLEGPNGKRVELVAVWIMAAGEDVPRFVTAYPGGSR